MSLGKGFGNEEEWIKGWGELAAAMGEAIRGGEGWFFGLGVAAMGTIDEIYPNLKSKSVFQASPVLCVVCRLCRSANPNLHTATSRASLILSGIVFKISDYSLSMSICPSSSDFSIRTVSMHLRMYLLITCDFFAP
ncbi:hypothetical protein Acr_16g0003160 [Actinidia rufa]|uniref:Uncharacterized protein n=1 Tax=Actinidia rufa TaxID=165716 RepID=A0A7J0FYB3_9ERIC|nr:hypothetical protein Acr_16g0003160 [Actinidia rufa]